MLNFTSSYALKTVSNIAALSTAGGTIYLHINENIDDADWSGESTILKFYNFRIYLAKIFSSVNLFIEHIGSVSNGLWVSNSLTNAQHQIAFSYDFSAGAPADPVLVVDGATAIIKISAPDGAYAIGAQPMLIGGESVTVETNPCVVPVGEIAVFVGTKLTEAQMIRLTSSRVMRMPLQFSACTHYWAMDEIADRQAYAIASAQINPDGDTTTSWNTATPHWSKINAADAVYLHADAGDDAETEEFTCSTDTIPAYRKVGAISIDVKGYKDSAASNPTVFTNISSDQTIVLSTSNAWAATLTTYVNLLNQATVDALVLYLTSPTMGSDEDIYIDQVKITLYYIWNRILDYKSGNYLVGTSDAVGVANNYLSYP